ncbi:alpha/beta fold hydrolase [Actinomadura fibrosa]|uniref:Alpha/beta fold hydrolase n=1 Tax=Actinomadura fibrosa TaxID=111802 RepID=A0ABW2Y2K3_9ACTN|nr:alpha/beta hydrolase [Actinomadura fibrosa]
MATGKPVVVLVHGAFTGSARWDRVTRRLNGHGLCALAVANPLRDLAGDAAHVRDVVAGIGRLVVLAGHSYGGTVITAVVGDPAVRSLVYVGAFAPEAGESALQLSGEFEGSILASALVAYPVASGGVEFRIDEEKYHHQFCADLDALDVSGPGWHTRPSWFVFGGDDRNIPAEAIRFMDERASSRGTREVTGASQFGAVAAAILDAVDGRSG